MQHNCLLCKYVYDEEKSDPDHGLAPGTSWDDIPDDWVCPDCGATKMDFEPVQGGRLQGVSYSF